MKSDLEQLIAPLVSDLGCEFWGCEYIPQGKYSLLRIYIDKVGGVFIDDCEKVSKEISAMLDVEDPIQGNYSLEVSSPGIPRPLFSLDHYSRYLDWQVQLKLRRPVNGSKKITAKILRVDSNRIELEAEGQIVGVQFSDILKANLIGE